MSDPFANYDRWLEAPYQRECEEAERAEWIAENSDYETDCCGAEIEYSDIEVDYQGIPHPVRCPECGEVAGVDVTEPHIPGEEYDEPEPPYYE